MVLLPFTSHFLRAAGTAWLLPVCFLWSCSSPLGRLPTIQPSEGHVSTDPARDAQVRLLKEAYRAFVQERYPTAVLFFGRYIDGSPDSPRLAEARWWLGRSHEQLGDYRAAMEQYRAIAAGQPPRQLNGTLYEGHALRRLDELRRLHARLSTGFSAQLALRLTVEQVGRAPALATWLQELIQGGVTALVVDPVKKRSDGRATFDLDGLKEIVAEARRYGLPVWAALDVHRAPGLDVKPEWIGVTVNARPREGLPAGPDIANPAYQTYLEGVAKSLGSTGCDGLFLAARSATGFSREFSEDSFRAFSVLYGLAIEPQQALGTNQSGESAGPQETTYWRWAGWKARSYSKLAARLRKAFRETGSSATLLVEVHEATVRTPIEGLEQYGEDVVDLAQRTGGAIAVRRDGRNGEMQLDKLGKHMGGLDRVWVSVPVRVAAVPSSVGDVKQLVAAVPESGRWNVFLTADSVESVP